MSLQDLIILSEKCEELEKTIKKQSNIIAKLKESNGFYADTSNWGQNKKSSFSQFLDSRDCDVGDSKKMIAGRLARQIKKEVEVLENEL